jgi:TPR repeat protein
MVANLLVYRRERGGIVWRMKRVLTILAMCLCLPDVGADNDRDFFLQSWRLAKQGDADAQYNLGAMYTNGKGVEKDQKEAVKWFRKSAEQGNAKGQFGLGVSYDDGKGVPEDDEEAAKWYRKSADQGDAKAQTNLGLMYYKGEGVKQDPKEALKLFRKASDTGLGEPQTWIGWMYENGVSVPKDITIAYAWYNIAAAGGHKNAKRHKGRLTITLTPEQIAEGQKHSKEMLKKNPKLLK